VPSPKGNAKAQDGFSVGRVWMSSAWNDSSDQDTKRTNQRHWPVKLSDFDSDGAVVRSHDVAPDERLGQARAQGLGNEEVVDAPPHVPGSRIGHRAPP